MTKDTITKREVMQADDPVSQMLRYAGNEHKPSPRKLAKLRALLADFQDDMQQTQLAFMRLGSLISRVLGIIEAGRGKTLEAALSGKGAALAEVLTDIRERLPRFGRYGKNENLPAAFDETGIPDLAAQLIDAIRTPIDAGRLHEIATQLDPALADLESMMNIGRPGRPVGWNQYRIWRIETAIAARRDLQDNGQDASWAAIVDILQQKIVCIPTLKRSEFESKFLSELLLTNIHTTLRNEASEYSKRCDRARKSFYVHGKY